MNPTKELHRTRHRLCLVPEALEGRLVMRRAREVPSRSCPAPSRPPTRCRP